MCKPMLVTLPLVLLLLDYWPLERFKVQRFTQCSSAAPLHPQSPFAARKAALARAGRRIVCGHDFCPARSDPAVREDFPSLARGECLDLLCGLFGPDVLAVGSGGFIPVYGRGVGVSEVVLSLVLLAGISAGVFVLRRRCPCFLTGWLWYLIMLVPVIGIVQVGAQARADRYTYLPQIGLYLMLTWAAADLCAGWRHRRVVLGGGSAVILAALIFCARAQTAYWRNSESLWTHTLACTSDNVVAHNNLGDALFKKGKVDEAMVHYPKGAANQARLRGSPQQPRQRLLQKGKVDEAIAHYQKALQINPDYAEAHNNLGNALLQKGQVDEAIAHFQKALQINPDNAEAHNNLGNALLQKGKVDEAIAHYQKALQIKPDNAEARYNLGNALLQKGRVDEAMAHFQKALQIKPDYAEAHNNLGNALLQKGRVDEAIAHYQKALQIKPDSADVLNNLAWLLATCPDAHVRDGVQAVQYAGRACELTHYGVTVLVGTLAAAYAEAGRYDDAVAAAQKACALATAAGERDLLEKNQKLLALYRAHQPYHEAAGKVVPAAPQP